MLNKQFHSPAVPRNVPQFLRRELEDFIDGKVDDIETVGAVSFFKAQHIDNFSRAVNTNIYIANALVFDKPDRAEVFYTFYTPDSAPLSMAKCPLHFIAAMTKSTQTPISQLWVEQCNRYSESVKSLKRLKAGNVVFIPCGVEFKRQREYFFISVGEDVFSLLSEDSTKPAQQVKVSRQQFSDVLGVKVTASSYSPIRSRYKMANTRRFGDFIIAPVAGNSDRMGIVGRAPTPGEEAVPTQLSFFGKPNALFPSTPFFM